MCKVEYFESADGSDDALLLVNSMAEQEKLDNCRRRHRSIFWITILKILSRQPNHVRIKSKNKEKIK